MVIKSNSMLLFHVGNLYFLEISHNLEIKEGKVDVGERGECCQCAQGRWSQKLLQTLSCWQKHHDRT